MRQLCLGPMRRDVRSRRAAASAVTPVGPFLCPWDLADCTLQVSARCLSRAPGDGRYPAAREGDPGYVLPVPVTCSAYETTTKGPTSLPGIRTFAFRTSSSTSPRASRIGALCRDGDAPAREPPRCIPCGLLRSSGSPHWEDIWAHVGR